MKKKYLRNSILIFLIILLFLLILSDFIRGKDFYFGLSQILVLFVILIFIIFTLAINPILHRISHEKILGTFRSMIKCVGHQVKQLVAIISTSVSRLVVKINPFLNVVFIVLLVVTQILAIKNISFLLVDIASNSNNAYLVVPGPEYLYRRIPENPLTVEYGAVGRLGLDFSQIYFPSKSFSSLISNYENGTSDPWNRQSKYAPFIHYICSISICKLDYGFASASHMLIQIIFFYGIIIYSFRKLGLKKDLILTVSFINIYLFLTPAGLAWMERGQFSLYIAIAYLLLFLALWKRNIYLVFLSAIFSFIKWTSFPTIFVIFLVFLIVSQDRKALRKNLLLALGFALTILFLNLIFPKETPHFLLGLINQEVYSEPDGNSLAFVLDKSIVKILPLIIISLSVIFVKVHNIITDWFFPLMIGSGIILIIYPTLAYDYNIPNLLGFVPIFLYWLGLEDNTTPLRLRKIMKYVFFIFIYLASISEYINVWSHNRFMTIYLYLFTSSLFIFCPILFSVREKAFLREDHCPEIEKG